MEAKIEKINELSKLLSVKTRMSDDLFHLFDKFGNGHLLSRLSLEKRLGWHPQHLMDTISGNNKAMYKIFVMAEALENGIRYMDTLHNFS